MMDQGKKVIIAIVGVTLLMLFGGIILISGGQKEVEQAKVELSSEGAWKTGAQNPGVVLVGFGDFSCPACRAYDQAVKLLLDKYPGDLQFVWRHFPLTQYENSQLAAYAAEAAGKQNKFWQMHEKLYAQQDNWKHAESATEKFDGYAKELDLDMDKYQNDLKSEDIAQIIQRDLTLGNQLQIQGTPTFFLNGEKMNLSGEFEEFITEIDKAVAESPKTDQSGYLARARMKVIVDEKEIDFTANRYQSSESGRLNENIYLEGGNGWELKVKNKTVTLNDFFTSLKIKFTPECLELDTGEKFCNSGQKSLKMYVNGEVSGKYQNHTPLDGDKILITYGDETVDEVQKQIETLDQ